MKIFYTKKTRNNIVYQISKDHHIGMCNGFPRYSVGKAFSCVIITFIHQTGLRIKKKTNITVYARLKKKTSCRYM